MLRVVGTRVVHRPFANFDIGKADVDPGGVRLNFADNCARGNVTYVSRLFKVGDVEGEHDVDAFVTAVKVRCEIERMIARKVEPRADVPHGCAQSFGDLDNVIPTMGRTGGEVGDDRDAIGRGEAVGGFDQRDRVRRRRRWNYGAAGGWHFNIVIELRFLQAGVVAHVNRSLARAHHHRVGAREGAGNAVDGRRLIIPFDEIADCFALHVGGVNPVDERPPFRFGERSGGAHDKNRRAIEIGVIDPHGRV